MKLFRRAPAKDAAKYLRREAEYQLVSQSAYFDADFYAKQAEANFLNEQEAIAHYLNEGERHGFRPAPNFDPVFYRQRYPDLAWVESLLVHYILHGLSERRQATADGCAADDLARGVGTNSHTYKDPAANSRRDAECSIILQSGNFDAGFYAEQAKAEFSNEQEAVAHYLDEGEGQGFRPAPHFDPVFYRERYPDLTGTESLLVHYILHGISERRQSTADGKRPPRPAPGGLVDEVLASGLFDYSYYQREADVPFADERSAAEHYVTQGEDDWVAPSDIFDPKVYIGSSPDLAGYTGLLLQHYHRYGRHEGRVATLRPDDKMMYGARPYFEDRETILIAAHEASRTGAPIVALTLAEHLSGRFNVIVLLMRDGELVPNFQLASHAVYTIGSRTISVSPEMWAERVVKPIVERFKVVHVVANSVETDLVMNACRYLDMGVLSLIHEFAEYIFPRHRLQDALESSTTVVFSSTLTESSAREYVSPSHFPRTLVFPQGRCLPPPSHDEQVVPAAMEVVLSAAAKGTKICIGCGSVEMRKGVDLFLQAASHCLRQGIPETLFVWIGNGFDPESGYNYSVWLNEHIRRGGLAGHFLSIPALPAERLLPLYRAADVMFLSSRLDPFPNVSIDALWEELPVVCFEDASGIAEYLKKDDILQEMVVPYLDTSAAAEQIMHLLRGEVDARKIRERLGGMARTQFSMETYVDRIVTELELIRAGSNVSESALRTDVSKESVGAPV